MLKKIKHKVLIFFYFDYQQSVVVFFKIKKLQNYFAFPHTIHITVATYLLNTSFTISLRYSVSLPTGRQAYTH